jgi:uncharacterized LabA/DUF88 family protein
MPNTAKLVFIDGQNIYKSLLDLNLELDLKNFYNYLQSKFQPENIFWFVKYTNQPDLLKVYKEYENIGFKMCYVTKNNDNKANVDADIITDALVEFYENGEYDLILATGDGDFIPLIRLFEQKNRKVWIVSASRQSTAGMLKYDRFKKIDRNNKISYISENLRNCLKLP